MILDEKNRQNLILLILQFLAEEGYEGSLYLLEQESGIFFNLHYFCKSIINGNWEEAEKYLSAFTGPDVNTYSRKMFCELYKWKYLEATDRSDGSESLGILNKDMSRIPVFKDDDFEDLVEVIALKDIRMSEQNCCVDKASSRAKLCANLQKLANSNPCLRGKLVLPNMNKSALMSLIFLICPNCNGGRGSLKEDLICLILQFLHEEKYKNTLHKLEQETKVFFNLNYLAEMMILGQLGKAEEYLVAFTDPRENKHSKAMFLEIQKLKYPKCTEWEVTTPPESLDILLPTVKLHASVAMLAKKNPVLRDKLKFPCMEKSRLLILLKQTMDWWIPHTCNNSNSLENVPVVPYLCGAPFSLNNKFNGTRPIKMVDCCKPKEIKDPSECNALLLPGYCSEERIGIARLTYSPSGEYILVLAEDATHKLWTWSSSQNESCKASIFPEPRLHQPPSRKTMKNEIANSVQKLTSCFAIKGSYLFSTSGERIAVFDLKTFEKVAAFGSPTPTATYFIFIPSDLLAVGLDNGSIFIHCLSTRKVKAKLEGHDQRITCLAFSRCYNILVSSGADGKLCVWSTKCWAKLTTNSTPSLCTTSLLESSLVTHIQFEPYQLELLVVHEGWIGVHEAPSLDCLVQWAPEQSGTPITCATYSCDGEMIYVGFRSGLIKVVDSKILQTISEINVSAYAQHGPRSLEAYPAVVAAHPSDARQICVGLSNGQVYVLAPLERRGGWAEAAGPQD